MAGNPHPSRPSQPALRAPRRTATLLAAAMGLTSLALPIGCASPIDRTSGEDLRQAVLAEYRRELEASGPPSVQQVSRQLSEVEANLTPERRDELEEMSGIEAYRDVPLNLGDSLTNKAFDEADEAAQPTVAMSLDAAVASAIAHNLDIRVARLNPAISQAQVSQALAAFDATFFTDTGYSKTTGATLSALTAGGASQTEAWNVGLGVRRALYTGGSVELGTSLSNNDSAASPIGTFTGYNTTLYGTVTQPLLRGFGTDVARAEIVLARNARAADVQQLKAELIQLAVDVEAAYWNLLLAQDALRIQTRLLERSLVDRQRVDARKILDASPVDVSEVNSRVESRNADVIAARADVRDASDNLKRLLDDPDLPLTSEVVITPTDRPIDAALTFSLADAIRSAMVNRPELAQALLNINDASVRQRVADNARLPLLDLAATVGLSGISGEGIGEAYSDLSQTEFIDYLISASLEVPIGNRLAEAGYDQRVFERQQSVLAYQSAAEDVLLDVKTALRTMLTNYKLIAATRAARLAAADSVRSIDEQIEAGVALDPTFLNFKLDAQERLADNETAEIQSLINYANAVTAVYAATGTLLDRNGIALEDWSWNE
ncbi:MAG: TolC family protein [Planctomycetota bacterium]